MKINNKIIFLFTVLFLALNSCTEEKIPGCTVASATNYNSEATEDDGSCTFFSEYVVGQNYGGGIIFYIDSTGSHGLIAAESDQSSTFGIEWNNGSNITTGASGVTVGSGANNTLNIVGLQGIGSYAASLCDTLTLNGFSDWYLPSRDELFLMYVQRSIIGGFNIGPDGTYWSSSEISSTVAWAQTFETGVQFSILSKASTEHVRAIRSF